MTGVVVACRMSLPTGRRPALVVADDAVVLGVLAGVRVAGANALGAALDPQRNDLLVLEGVVQPHVAVEEVLHGATVVAALGEAADGDDLLTQSREFGLKFGDVRQRSSP